MYTIKSKGLQFHFLKQWIYTIYNNGTEIGFIEFRVRERTIFISHVFIEEEARDGLFTAWVKQFEAIIAISVLPESIDYWKKLNATIYSMVSEPRFLDLIFMEDELND